MAAVLFHPEFYKASYSSCGCHDNRMDKIWWNEQWMGYPVDSNYIACSNVENAHRLTRPLTIVIRVIFIKLWFQFFPFRWFHAHEFFYEEIETLVFSVAFAHAVPYAR